MHIICLLLLYVKKLIPSSTHFCVLLQNVDVLHYCVFALSAKLVKMGPGIFCSNQNFPFRLITLCLYIPMSCMNTFSKSMAVSWEFFRELFFYTPLTLKLFPSIVIVILESRDFVYLHRILTELLSLLILLSIILYQVLFVCSSTDFFLTFIPSFDLVIFVISSMCSPSLSNRNIHLNKVFSMLAMSFIMSLNWKSWTRLSSSFDSPKLCISKFCLLLFTICWIEWLRAINSDFRI